MLGAKHVSNPASVIFNDKIEPYFIYDWVCRPKHSDGSCPMLHLGLRYFTPTEIARLMGFPSTVRHPAQATPKQLRKLYGNSLNVRVVAILMKLLIDPAS